MGTALTFNSGGDQTILNQNSQSTIINPWATDNSSNWKIEGEFTYFENALASQGSHVAAGSTGPGIANGIICTGSAIYAKFSAYTLTILGGFVDNDVIRFTLERVGNTVTFEANGFSESLTTSSTFFTSFVGFGNDMSSNTNQYKGQIQGTWVFSGGGQDTRTYILDNQSTSAGTVTLVDETSGFNLLSNNMSTDGSVWVDSFEYIDPVPDPSGNEEFDYIKTYILPDEEIIDDQGNTDVFRGSTGLIQVPLQDTPWISVRFTGLNPPYVITKFDSEFSVGERIYPRFDETLITSMYAVPVYDPKLNKLVCIRYDNSAYVYGLYTLNLDGTGFQAYKYVDFSSNVFRCLAIKDNERYIVKYVSLSGGNGGFSICKYDENWNNEEVIVTISDVYPPYFYTLTWDGTYWNFDANDPSLDNPDVVYRYDTNWVLIDVIPVLADFKSGLADYSYKSTEDKWYVADPSSPSEVGTHEIHQLVGKNKPISNNLIQYNGQDILDVKYSDQDSVLQDVEMRLGNVVVWGGVETLYGLDFSKSSAQDRGVVIYSDTGNTKLTFRNDFKVIGRASFKADTMLISSNVRNDQYIFLRPEGVVECVANYPTNSRVRTTTTLVEGEFFDVIVERIGSTVTLKVNNEEVSFNYNAPVSYGLFGNDLTFPDYPYTGILSGTWEFYDEGVLIRSFNISESGNAKTGSGQPVLIDSVLGENAVGQNMNTDDSNWVQLEPTPQPVAEWGLQFDGNNDYLSMSHFMIAIRDKFLISGKFIFKSGTTLLSSTVRPGCILFTSLGYIILRTDSPSLPSFFAIGPFEEGELIDLKIERAVDGDGLVKMTGNEKEASINTGLSSFEFNRIGRPSFSVPNDYYSGQLSGEWIFNVIGKADRIYDFNFSGESKTGSGQPVVIDTVSGNNAVGVNMNTDDSNWIDLS